MGCTQSKNVNATEPIPVKTTDPIPAKSTNGGESLKEKSMSEKEPETQVYNVKQNGPDGMSESVKIIEIHPDDENDDID